MVAAGQARSLDILWRLTVFYNDSFDAEIKYNIIHNTTKQGVFIE
jgi:hypothetical protein